jgi:hypothetical protein
MQSIHSVSACVDGAHRALAPGHDAAVRADARGCDPPEAGPDTQCRRQHRHFHPGRNADGTPQVGERMQHRSHGIIGGDGPVDAVVVQQVLPMHPVVIGIVEPRWSAAGSGEGDALPDQAQHDQPDRITRPHWSSIPRRPSRSRFGIMQVPSTAPFHQTPSPDVDVGGETSRGPLVGSVFNDVACRRDTRTVTGPRSAFGELP